ncbi:MAG TPA: CC/Se motif family (seleno)protein [Syntrophales bacterium]|nr:CC/Se motif family (seleno)protein [Syntrophales bacterium]
MLTLSPEARAYAVDNGGTIFLDYIIVGDCCIPYQPEPSVRVGMPHDPERYRQEQIDGVTVFVPNTLPQVPLVIELNSFMGFKRLVVHGWRHC